MDTSKHGGRLPAREAVGYLLYAWRERRPGPWNRDACLEIADDVIQAYLDYQDPVVPRSASQAAPS